MKKANSAFGKVSLKSLADLKNQHYYFGQNLSNEPISFYLNDIYPVEFLFNPKAGSDKLFVLFCGDADRKRYSLPVFQRWKWAQEFPGHCLYFSDPTLHLDPNLGIAWYCGNKQFDPLYIINEIVKDFAATLSINESDVIFYGSSGGGFAALRSLDFINSAKAVTINPQINIFNFFVQRKVDLMLDICFPGLSRVDVLNQYGKRIDLMNDKHCFKNSYITYAQNTLDKSHYNEHFIPFMEKIDVPYNKEFSSKKVKTILFENSDGHGKAEAGNPEIFDKLINSIS